MKEIVAQPKIRRLGYSFRQACEATSLSRRTLEYLICKGKLSAKKVGSRTVIKAASLEKLLE